MNVGIYGGGIDHPSSVVRKISEQFEDAHIVNGFKELPAKIDHDLTIWMPVVDNAEKKAYPTKKVGSVLICSKLIHDNRTDIDAIARIFKMRGNAVIAIYIKKNYYHEPYCQFKLIDALGNVWCDSSDIETLATQIKAFYKFSKAAVRYNSRSEQMDRSLKFTDEEARLNEFIAINSKLKDSIQTSCGNRFFGNLSTRCAKLFPSYKGVDIWVSPRNVNKEHIKADDMVLAKLDHETVVYEGVKPSVDTPVQLLCYYINPDIHYMIHGHAFIQDAEETTEYFVCGDIREAAEVSETIEGTKFGAINLMNHGFLLYADTLDNLSKLIDESKFTYDRFFNEK